MLSAFTPSVTLLLLYLTGVETPTARATQAALMIGAGNLGSSRVISGHLAGGADDWRGLHPLLLW